MLKDIIPVVPVLIVTLSACAVLLAESFRREHDWMPVGWLGVIGVIGGIVTSLSLWGRNAVGFGVIVVDNYTIFFNVLICLVGLLTILISTGTAERDHLPTGEDYVPYRCSGSPG